MAAKDKARGSALELHVGRMFGGRRRRNGEGVGFDDCVTDDEHGNTVVLPISLECKAYAVLQLQTKWIEQAVRNCGGRPWAVVQRPKGSRRIVATVDLDFLHELCVRAGLIAGPPVTELAWAAGFFDGEGSAFKNESLLQIALVQTDERPLHRFADAVRVGNVTGPYERDGRNDSPIWRWSVAGQKALPVIRALWAHLSDPKREQISRVASEVGVDLEPTNQTEENRVSTEELVPT